MKRICVFCASSAHVPSPYHEAAASFGRAMADRNYELVFGGGGIGLMGTLAKAVKEHGGSVYGVIPAYLRTVEDRFDDCDTLVITETLAERKRHMMDISDGFAVLPGGYGTLDETFEILTLKRHGRMTCPVVLLNTDGFFDLLIRFLERLSEEGFLSDHVNRDIILAADPVSAVGNFAEPGTDPT